MVETVHVIEMYVLGFAAVWLAILAVCCLAGIAGRRRHNWDRALARELLVAPARRELPTRTLGPSTESTARYDAGGP
jgi:hypothetical protein